MARFNAMFVPAPEMLAIGFKPLVDTILVDDHKALDQIIQRATARAADELDVTPFSYEPVAREDLSKGMTLMRPSVFGDEILGTVTWVEAKG